MYNALPSHFEKNSLILNENQTQHFALTSHNVWRKAPRQAQHIWHYICTLDRVLPPEEGGGRITLRAEWREAGSSAWSPPILHEIV